MGILELKPEKWSMLGIYPNCPSRIHIKFREHSFRWHDQVSNYFPALNGHQVDGILYFHEQPNLLLIKSPWFRPIFDDIVTIFDDEIALFAPHWYNFPHQ